MIDNFRFLVFSTENHKLVIHNEFSLSVLDKIELRDFCEIGKTYFEIANNSHIPLNSKFRLFGFLWGEISKNISVYFFTLIRDKTSEDLAILHQISLILNSLDFNQATIFADKERKVYNQYE